MILRFLNLFPQFRYLEDALDRSQQQRIDLMAEQQNVVALKQELAQVREALQEENTQKLILQDRLDSALSDRSRMWDLMEKSIEEMKVAYQIHVNIAMQRMGAGAAYPEAPHLPMSAPKPPENPVVERPLLPSEAIAMRTKQFIESQINGRK